MASVYFARLRRTTPAGCGECAELAARQRSCSWRLTGARSLRQRLRSFEMLLQGWESLTRIRSGWVALLLRSLLVLGDFLLVILNHLAREPPIEGLTRELAEARVHRLLIFVGFRRRVHTELCRDRRRLLRPSGVVLLERLPERAHPFTGSLFLGELPHLHFGKIALDRLGDKGLAGLIARPRLCPRAEAGAGQGRCKAHTYNQPCHDFSPSEGLRLNKRHDEGWCSRLTAKLRPLQNVAGAEYSPHGCRSGGSRQRYA